MEFYEALETLRLGKEVHRPDATVYLTMDFDGIVDAYSKYTGELIIHKWSPDKNFYDTDWELWYAQATFPEAMEWLKSGYRITRLSWPEGNSLRIKKDSIGRDLLIFTDAYLDTSEGWSVKANVSDFYADDWVAINGDWQIINPGRN